MKTVGIIGGLGPETTAKFYLEIISSCIKINKNERPPILIWNVPIPLKIEEELIINNIGEEKYLPFLIKGAINLEKAGADFLVMPCNTMHIFIEEIRSAVRIPVLSIVDETIEVINKMKVSKVGVLSTLATIDKRLFKDKLNNINVKEIIPNKNDQAILDKTILNLVLNIKNSEDKNLVNRIIKKIIKKGITKIILACTDLQLVVRNRSDVEILDTMKILAEATVQKLMKTYS